MSDPGHIWEGSTDVAEADDSVMVQDLFLAADLEALGCRAVADEIRNARSHDRVEWIRLLCSELLTSAAEGSDALAPLQRLVELDDDEMNREEEARLDRAKHAGAEARATGRVPIEVIALLEELRAIGSPLAAALERCTCPADVDKVREFITLWHGDEWRLA